MWEIFVVGSNRGRGTLLSDAWEQIKTALAKKLTAGAYQNWIARTTLGSVENGDLNVRVPDAPSRDWIQQEYTAEIYAAIADLRLPVRRVLFSLPEAAAAQAAGAGSASTFSVNGRSEERRVGKECGCGCK